MKALILQLCLTVFIAIIIASFFPVIAADNIAGSSATIGKKSTISYPIRQNTLLKRYVIKKVLQKYKSPLAKNVDSFVKTCMQYRLDCYLLPSITGVESTFGKFIYPNSSNPFGWGGGLIMFKNWGHGIATVGQGLRKNYLNRGARNVYQIGKKYAPPSLTWAYNVDFFMKEFYNEEIAAKGLFQKMALN